MPSRSKSYLQLRSKKLLVTVRKQFARITRHGDFSVYDARVLSPEILFKELCSQGRASGEFADWFTQDWVPRVHAFAEEQGWDIVAPDTTKLLDDGGLSA